MPGLRFRPVLFLLCSLEQPSGGLFSSESHFREFCAAVYGLSARSLLAKRRGEKVKVKGVLPPGDDDALGRGVGEKEVLIMPAIQHEGHQREARAVSLLKLNRRQTMSDDAESQGTPASEKAAAAAPAPVAKDAKSTKASAAPPPATDTSPAAAPAAPPAPPATSNVASAAPPAPPTSQHHTHDSGGGGCYGGGDEDKDVAARAHGEDGGAGAVGGTGGAVGGSGGGVGSTSTAGGKEAATAKSAHPVHAAMTAAGRKTMLAEMKKRVDAWFADVKKKDAATAAKVDKLSEEDLNKLLTHKCDGTTMGWKGADKHQGGVVKLESANFPGVCSNDNGNGFRQAFGSKGGPTMYNGDSIPLPPAGNIGNTFDVEYAFAHGLSQGIMHALHGGNFILGPGAQVWQNPHGGRLWEYMPGEDPTLGVVLAGAYAVAPKLQNVGCTWKHFAVQDEENTRYTNDVQVPREAFYDMYWKPFVAGMSVGGQSVMCSYSWIWGRSDCSNPELLGSIHEVTDRAFVVSDWGATTTRAGGGCDWMLTVAKYEDNSSADYVKAGLDAEQPSAMSVSVGGIKDAPKADKQKSVHRIFGAVEDLGNKAIDNSHRATIGDAEAKRYGGKDKILKESHSVAIALAAEAMVLLKNEGNLLPLKKPALKKVVNCDIDPKQGITKFLGGKPMRGSDFGSGEIWQEVPKVSEGLKKLGIEVGGADAEASLVCLDERSAEGLQRPSLEMGWKGDGATGKLIVLMGVPGQVQIKAWSNKAAAIVSSVYLGYGVGPALGQLLTGVHNPAGHLSYSIVTSADHIKGANPDYTTTDGATGHETGYRRLQKAGNKAEYGFGHGIPLEGSWEKFKLDVVEHDLELRRISFCVTNGNAADLYGKSKIQEWPSPTVQFFAQIGSRKWKELVAFRKIRFLGPGKKRCSFVFYDPIAAWSGKSETGKFEMAEFKLFASFNGYEDAKTEMKPGKTTGKAGTAAFDRKQYWRFLRERYMKNQIQVGAKEGDEDAEIAQHLPIAGRKWEQLWKDWIALGENKLGQDVRGEDPF